MLIPRPSPIYDDENLRDKLWHLHGVLLCLAFFIIFPAGVVAIRGGSRRALRYHYLLQLSGTALALAGVCVGFLTSTRIGVRHQYIGLAIGGLLLVQPILGWKHHIDYRRIKRRTWISYAHLWIGRLAMGGLAWADILLGLRMRKYGFMVMAGAGVAILLLVISWMLWGLGVIKAPVAGKMEKVEEADARQGLMNAGGDEFALEDLDEGSDNEQLK